MKRRANPVYPINMRFAVRLAALSLLPMMLLAQPPQDGKKGPPPPPKNLQVLTPEDLQSGIMQKFAAALGGNCQTCHDVNDYSSDAKDHKVIAHATLIVYDPGNQREISGWERARHLLYHMRTVALLGLP